MTATTLLQSAHSVKSTIRALVAATNELDALAALPSLQSTLSAKGLLECAARCLAQHDQAMADTVRNYAANLYPNIAYSEDNSGVITEAASYLYRASLCANLWGK
jgi:hypothetical protein